MANRICFVELPVGSTSSVKAFYTDAFGFAMIDFGPTYSCTLTGDVDLGLPGGKRFRFRNPAGNELAAMQPD
jgi:hypothetical protein